MSQPKTDAPILQAENLVKTFPISGASLFKKDVFTAVDNISFDIREGEMMGLLGESGCGKSTTAGMIMGLISPTSGEIRYQGRVISGLKDKVYRPYRRDIQMVFQNPFDCLDPEITVGRLLAEPLTVWGIGETKDERSRLIAEMLEACGLPADCVGKKPPEFSGGQLQRIAIARALLVQPKFLVADEIVSALDVPVQNQILELLMTMKDKMGLTVLFITHDLAVIRRIADRVMVMRGGKLLSIGETRAVLDTPEDPYIEELTRSAFIFH